MLYVLANHDRTTPNKRLKKKRNSYARGFKIFVHFFFFPSSAQQQREMTKFCVFWIRRTTVTNFPYFYLGRYRYKFSMSKISDQ